MFGPGPTSSCLTSNKHKSVVQSGHMCKQSGPCVYTEHVYSHTVTSVNEYMSVYNLPTFIIYILAQTTPPASPPCHHDS